MLLLGSKSPDGAQTRLVRVAFKLLNLQSLAKGLFYYLLFEDILAKYLA
jgi:hypothetical protein